ncbi:hypothetical protein [Evansella cellulosilytica]|uniref:TolA-binding protein n=1 Tax=Evansella cellulosilytica (strain ATCC 21833 / DSM 2522 / FERM P-1141 / JCM 9156 / N-4) TaxID=649639 RepID=E6TT43_EVAC2|nr:hypothetical protein [Evansella cellulosilytica]ADU31951.1 hypothetical protein Bcell_3711 [Evansella cellulosilytica DSM 2522]
MDYLSKYNDAISLIHNEQYGKAEVLLYSILEADPHHSFTNWTLGLLEAATGKPYAALKRWQHVSPSDVPYIEEEIEKLTQSLPTYETLFAKNNEALKKAANKDFIEAKRLFVDILLEGEALPLPMEIYKSYFLTLLINEETAVFHDEYDKAPSYVKDAAEITDIYWKIKNDEDVGDKLVKYQSKNKWMLVSASTVAAASIAFTVLLFTTDLFERESTPASASPTVEVVETIIEDTEKIETLEQQLTQLSEDIEMSAHLHDAEVQRNEQLLSLIDAAGLSEAEMKINAAESLFRIGYSAYQAGNDVEAIESLGESVQYSQQHYVSDDAHFFLIQALLREEETTRAEQEMDSFLTAADEYYINSPYIDDVLLLRAQRYILNDEMEEAFPLLTMIQEQYAEEWTAHEAERLLKNQ